eukprot:TRINITY_DN272_c0_g1::TRINITY_DN272_c0_g1_i1::g.1664::m.1664 TRINITY_DN272_c0_g1::TRINITY_DN272_c0_g1_i1::g.1664  ORF type:complete len:278 (+),score=25.09,sp/A5PJG7/CCHL_BOVIN/44.76/2e-64,Cyto_heme_lyase/PF01265.12/1.4e-72 TRINITY_DN272_c0_g1_i1:70-834(+)
MAESGCPIKRKSPEESKCPVQHESRPAEEMSSCPVATKGYKGSTVYNVYSEAIDPKNMMPPANQIPSPGQQEPLSTYRQSSSIPRGGTEETWLYPSEQMFFNALRRKGKGDDVSERDVSMMIAIHNHMNEKTWDEVLEWEKMHESECGSPMLLRFIGKPDDYSPRARLKNIFGLAPLPFDRHDWFVDRCGKQVRYIIDFYYNDEIENIPDRGERFERAIRSEVRPALDSVESVVDRTKMFFNRNINRITSIFGG